MITLRKYFGLSFMLAFLLILSSCQPNGSGAANGDEVLNNNGKKIFTNIDVPSFEAKMKGENVVVLDVRTPSETAQGMVEGAIEVDYQALDFETKINALDKDKTYLVYCRSGKRSVGASNIMAEQGFGDIYNLLGGYKAWSAEQ